MNIKNSNDEKKESKSKEKLSNRKEKQKRYKILRRSGN